jgi:nitrogen fixation NifU-like protein
MADQAPLYTPTTIDHFRRPRNLGRLDDANGVGRIDDRATDNLITIYLKLEHGRVSDARFRTFGCSACVAASSIATELVRGRSVEGAEIVDAALISAALGGLPSGKKHCAELVARALGEALAMARQGRS